MTVGADRPFQVAKSDEFTISTYYAENECPATNCLARKLYETRWMHRVCLHTRYAFTRALAFSG